MCFVLFVHCHEQECFWVSVASEVSGHRERPNVTDQFGTLSHAVFVARLINLIVAAANTRDKHVEHRQVDDQYLRNVDNKS